MAMTIIDQFDLKAAKFNFSRDYFESVELLNKAPKTDFPNNFITNVAGTLYQLIKTEKTPDGKIDETNGTWKKLEFSDKNALTTDDDNTISKNGSNLSNLRLYDGSRSVTIDTALGININTFEGGVVLTHEGLKFDNDKGSNTTVWTTNGGTVDISGLPSEETVAAIQAKLAGIDDTVKGYVDSQVGDLAQALVFKGGIPEGGLPANPKVGDTYVVGTAGDYAGETCEVGDTIICTSAKVGETAAKWLVVQKNLDGAAIKGDELDWDGKLIVGAGGNMISGLIGTEGQIIQADANGNPTYVTPEYASNEKLTELEEEIGIIESVDVYGKGENWSTKTLSRVYKQGEKILVNISGNPTFAGTSEGQTFIYLEIRRKGTSTSLKRLYHLVGNVAFEPKEIVYTATEDCVIYVEGRWHTDENVRIEVKGSLIADIAELNLNYEQIKTEVSAASKMERTAQRLFYSRQLNFNNTTKQIEIAESLISSPTTTNTRIEIPAQNVDYTFDSDSTTLPLLVYDLSTSGYKTTTIQGITSNMYVLAAISITGKGTSSIVHKVYYSAVADCRIDGINAEIKAEDALAITKNINAVLDIQDLRINPTPKFKVGTNYNNSISTAASCIADETYYKVYPNSTIKIDLAEGWLIRIVQCNARKENLKGNDEYTALTEKLLRADTEYIRFAVENPNYSPTNPISLDVIDNDTCKLYKQESKRLSNIEASTAKIEEISSLPDVIFGSEINFDDYKITVYDERSGKWVGGGSRSYNGIFVPVRKGYKIKIIANPNYSAMYSQVKEYGVSGQPVLYADGFEDRVSVEKGTTAVFEILDTCKYLWVANMSNVENKPSYIGFESIGSGQQVEEDIITRNKHKEAQVLCAGYSGDAIKHFGFIHVSDIHTRKEDYKCFESMCKFLQHYDNLKCAIVTGDLVYDHFASPIDYYNKGLEQTTKSVYNVIGNHDAGQQDPTTPSLDRVSSDAQCYEKYIAPYIGNWEVKSDGGGVPHPSGKSYYFNDFTAEKVRLIVVCEFETDYELSETDPEHKLKWSREYRAMHQEQINWLIESLSTTPSGYGVIVALHQLDTTKEEYNEFVSGYLAGKRSANIYTNDSQINWFVRILDAFKKHTTLNFTFNQTGAVVGTMTVNADFTNKTDTEFICTICGHTHNDYIGHYKDTDLVVLNIGSDNTTYTGKICPRKVGTIAEDLFNVVNVDRNRKKITIIRIGSDSSVEGQDRRRITIGY